MKKILFVCTGNTCRSPMAEGFMKAVLAKDPQLSSRFHASSAGIFAYAGDRASSHSTEVMQSGWEIDISGHAASALDEKAVFEAFLILTMTVSQKESILYEYPEAIGKTYTLKEFVENGQAQACHPWDNSRSLDISDPYGKALSIYSRCAMEIKEAVDKLTDRLKQIDSFNS